MCMRTLLYSHNLQKSSFKSVCQNLATLPNIGCLKTTFNLNGLSRFTFSQNSIKVLCQLENPWFVTRPFGKAVRMGFALETDLTFAINPSPGSIRFHSALPKYLTIIQTTRRGKKTEKIMNHPIGRDVGSPYRPKKALCYTPIEFRK